MFILRNTYIHIKDLHSAMASCRSCTCDIYTHVYIGLFSVHSGLFSVYIGIFSVYVCIHVGGARRW